MTCGGFHPPGLFEFKQARRLKPFGAPLQPLRLIQLDVARHLVDGPRHRRFRHRVSSGPIVRYSVISWGIMRFLVLLETQGSAE